MSPGKAAVKHATYIVEKLKESGYIAYFAGGWVRDKLRGELSDEIDIATSANPETIRSLFPKTIAVGIAFGVVIVVIDHINFEVSTFRKDLAYTDGRHPTGVDFSTPLNDAMRRDFTINGMFYDPLRDEIIDYVGGREDLAKGVIRSIGSAALRIEEDRLRMIRAVRFAARFNFTIDSETKEAIRKKASCLFPSVSIERVYQELSKMTLSPHFNKALLLLNELSLLSVIFPTLTLTDNEIQNIPYSYFPKGTSPILYLLELFPKSSLDEKIALCRYFKVSNEEIKLTELAHRASELLSSSPSHYDLASFYAKEPSKLLIELYSLKIPFLERQKFLSSHEELREKLSFHIDRLISKKPILTADHLKAKGIAPSPEMGRLLKIGEELAINEDLREPEEILRRLL